MQLAVADAVLSSPSSCEPCGVTVDDIQDHLRGMKTIYDAIGCIESPEALYEYLLELEAVYVGQHRQLHAAGGPRTESFPHTVYQLHPLLYLLGTNPFVPKGEDIERIRSIIGVCVVCKRELPSYLTTIMYLQHQQVQCTHCMNDLEPWSNYKTRYEGSTAFDEPLRDILSKCPHRSCRRQLTKAERFKLHLVDEPIACGGCNKTLRYETFQIATFIHEYPMMTYKSEMREGTKVEKRLHMPKEIPSDGRWDSYTNELRRTMAQFAKTQNTEGVYRFREVVYAHRIGISSQPPGAFSMDLVRGMYRQLSFVTKVCANFDYWMNPTILRASIRRYEQFVHLLVHDKKTTKKKGLGIVPTIDIDLAWHTHQTHPLAYQKYTTKVAKRVLDHDDSVGGSDLHAGYLHTCVAWSKLYKQPYSSYVPPSTTLEGMVKAGAKVARGASRFVGVDDLEDGAEGLASVVGTPVFESRFAPSPQLELLHRCDGLDRKKYAEDAGGCVLKPGDRHDLPM
ncbi:hypothetical protein SPRG_06500 [Saprolegnia parasitica CBS 223.65]|uniref:Uncharacterized protein n=1 Tax=Saprolegnia parasitica (strain CBS 223.65) TaxID=695850 RepID=A0A067CQ50_SAPPC|nr:hypothetical protein SPRG_06500 [Saprolegnia parasitica CBS 223.65]KDO28646.1 hypothetical protein SPRG_06500 [Saprolegnia parasitica CBS 223.65]|eukprot:XP_012200707.1 hypothetical protein SPRG_06500 [Saprolegnia parasitica CBS 223.65]